MSSFDDDEMELEMLRKAALAAMKSKKPTLQVCNPVVPSIPNNHFLPPIHNYQMKGHRRRNNLLVLTSNEDDSVRPSVVKSGDRLKPPPSSKKSEVTGISRFDRIREDSDSESDEDDVVVDEKAPETRRDASPIVSSMDLEEVKVSRRLSPVEKKDDAVVEVKDAKKSVIAKPNEELDDDDLLNYNCDEFELEAADDDVEEEVASLKSSVSHIKDEEKKSESSVDDDIDYETNIQSVNADEEAVSNVDDDAVQLEFEDDLIQLDDVSDLYGLDGESAPPSRRESRALSNSMNMNQSKSVPDMSSLDSSLKSNGDQKNERATSPVPIKTSKRQRVPSEMEEGEVVSTFDQYQVMSRHHKRPRSHTPPPLIHSSTLHHRRHYDSPSPSPPPRMRRRRSSSPQVKKKKKNKDRDSPERRKKDKSKKSKKKRHSDDDSGGDDLRNFLNKRRTAAIESVQQSAVSSVVSVVAPVISQRESILNRLGTKSS